MKIFCNKILFLICALCLFMFSACSEVDSQVSGTLEKAPEFTLENMQGAEVRLSELLKDDKKVVLVFFTTWCVYCVREIPEVNNFYQQNMDKAHVYGINIQESKKKVEAFAESKGIKYPIIFDTDGRVASLYGIRGIPAVIGIDKDGSLVYRGHNVEGMDSE
ncbi:MAG: TlpA disulfide reductase family protein [Candidatus Omnitrophota bacterium]